MIKEVTCQSPLPFGGGLITFPEIFYKDRAKAWINTSICDCRDGASGKLGYEINFNRYFFKYQPPHSLEVIEADIRTFGKEIMRMLMEVGE